MFDFFFKAVKWTGTYLYNSFVYNIGSALATEAVITLLKNLNDSLTEYQVDRLRDMVYRAFMLHREGRDVRHILSGVCALSLNISHQEGLAIIDNIVSLFQADGAGSGGRRSTGLHFDDVSDEYDIMEDDDLGATCTQPSPASRESQPRPQSQAQAQTEAQKRPLQPPPSRPSSQRIVASSADGSGSGSGSVASLTPTTSATPGPTRQRRSPREILLHDYKISPARLREIPTPLYPSLIRTLRDPERTNCVISLEDLVERPEGSSGPVQIASNVVVLFQRSESPGQSSSAAENSSGDEGTHGGSSRHPKFHAYLFSKEALDEWFSSSGTSTNPLTREDIDITTQYYRLS